MWWGFAFHEFSLSPFAQALPLLFDSKNAFEDMDSDESELRRDVHGGKPKSLRGRQRRLLWADPLLVRIRSPQ